MIEAWIESLVFRGHLAVALLSLVPATSDGISTNAIAHEGSMQSNRPNRSIQSIESARCGLNDAMWRSITYSYGYQAPHRSGPHK